MNGYERAIWEERRELIEEAHTDLIDASHTDDRYWETLACGQDTEEAEASGYLNGYRDALAAIVELMFHGHPETLTSFAAEAQENAKQQRAELRGEDL